VFAYHEVKPPVTILLILLMMLGACTEQLAVRPEGDFSWQPGSQMSWPVRGTMVGAFGDSSRANHQGVDLAARPDEPVTAALAGKVDYIGDIPGYGNVIALSHSEHLITVYAHVAEPRVRQGDVVSHGQTIASIGPEGFVHYEVRESKQAVDPQTLIAFAPSPPSGGAVDFSRSLSEEEPAGGSVLAGVLGAERPHIPPPPPNPVPPPPPARSETEVTETPPVAERNGSNGWAAFGLGAALVGSNLVYVPTKLTYAGVGALTGGFALVLAHDLGVASSIWKPTLGGDYFVTEGHVRGAAPLRFFGQGEDAADTNSRATSSADRRSPSTR
jgi:peptidase M23-like protein